MNNSSAAEHIASIANVHIIMRERGSLKRLEALLLGSAGLLDIYPEDDYIAELKREYHTLMLTYNIRPIHISELVLKSSRTYYRYTLRLVQLASWYHHSGVDIERIISCSNNYTILRAFTSDATAYWLNLISHITKDADLCSMKSHSVATNIAINVLAPILYTHGLVTRDEEYEQRAIGLLNSLPGESNVYTTMWGLGTFAIYSALESQAMIQLTTEYCKRGACAECPLFGFHIR